MGTQRYTALVPLGASQTVKIRPLSEFLIPCIYRIFRASQNGNRWCIINKMFAKFQPLDDRVNFSLEASEAQIRPLEDFVAELNWRLWETRVTSRQGRQTALLFLCDKIL